MHHPLIAGLLGIGTSELQMIMLIIGICAVFAFPCVIVAIALYFKNRQRQMWHETARLALEKGQPLPAEPGGDLRARIRFGSEHDDIRAGLILVAVGIGIAVFFKEVGAREAMGIGAIPGFIGVALLLLGAFTRKKTPVEDRPPRT